MYRGAEVPSSPESAGLQDRSVNSVERRRRTKSVLTHYKAGIPPKMFAGAFFKMTPLPWIFHSAGWPLLHDIHRARIEYQFDILCRFSRNGRASAPR